MGEGTVPAAPPQRTPGRGRLVVVLIVVALVAGGALYAVFGGSRASPTTATVSVVQTAMEAQTGGGVFAAALDGAILSVGDRVRTDANGRGFLTFFDGSTLEVEPGARVTVSELAINADGSTVVRLEQTLGETWASVRKFANPNSRFEIKTPASTAVVRGTGFHNIVLPSLTTIVRPSDGTVAVQAQGVEQQSPAGTQVTTQLGQPPSAPQPVPPAAGLRASSTAGTSLTVVTPNGLGCGDGRSDAPGCVEGSVVLRDIVSGTYTVLVRAATSVNATLTLEGQLGPTTVSTQALTHAMNRGDLVKTTVQVTIDGQGRPVVGTPTAFESLTSVCGAEARGRVFSTGSFEERTGALQQVSGVYTIVFTEAELTATLAQPLSKLEGVPVTISNGRVRVDVSGLEFTADVAGGPISVRAKAQIIAGTEGGRLVLKLRSLDLGPLTPALAGQLTERVETALASVGDALPGTVQRIAFRAGCFAVVGSRS